MVTVAGLHNLRRKSSQVITKIQTTSFRLFQLFERV